MHPLLKNRKEVAPTKRPYVSSDFATAVIYRTLFDCGRFQDFLIELEPQPGLLDHLKVQFRERNRRAQSGIRRETQIPLMRGNYMLVWRVLVKSSVYKYYKLHASEFASRDDPLALENFMILLGEVARISAFVADGAEAADEQVHSAQQTTSRNI